MRSVPLHDVAEVQPALAAAGLDAAVVISPRNIWHLTGYPRWRRERPGNRRSAVAIAYPDAAPTLVAGRFQEEISLMRAWSRDLISYADYVESPLTRAAEILRRRQLAAGRIGIETQFLVASFADELTAGLENAKLVPCDDLLARVWTSRRPVELELMRQNVETLSRIIAKTVAECQEGESELTLHRRILAAIRQAGGNEGWGRTVTGERRLIPAAMSSERLLQPRDLVTVEYACAFRTYPAKIGRMTVVGEPSVDDQQRYDRYIQALESIAGKVGPGQSGREIFERTQSTFQAAGLAPRWSTVGNALDIAYYGRPALSPAETLSTRPGMFLSLEPETSDGFKTSLLLEITEDGATRVPDGLPPLDQFLLIPTRP